MGDNSPIALDLSSAIAVAAIPKNFERNLIPTPGAGSFGGFSDWTYGISYRIPNKAEDERYGDQRAYRRVVVHRDRGR